MILGLNLKKAVFYSLAIVIIAACSGNKVIEKSGYLESESVPELKIPADMDFVRLKTRYPVPEVQGSIAGKSAQELEKLKNPPNLLPE